MTRQETTIKVPGTVDCVYPMPKDPDTMTSLVAALTDEITEISFTVGAIYIGGELVRNHEKRITGSYYNTMDGRWFIQERNQYQLPETASSGVTFESLLEQLKQYATGNSGVSVAFTFHAGVGRHTHPVDWKTVLITEEV